jgi:hypothetical protein
MELYKLDKITIEDAKRMTHSMDFERKVMFESD